MQKIMKRTLALILAVVLCFSAMPFSAFAVEMTPDETQSSQAQPSEAPAESSQPEPSTAPEVSPQPGADATPGPDESPKPTATPEAFPSPSAEPSPTPAEPADPYETELTQVDAQQIWPALQRARARAAAGIGTGGVLQMGYYCFKSEVGTLTTLGEYVSQMPAKTMLINGTNVAAYCLEHEKGATGGTPYTWTDMSVNAQDTVGTIMALGFQWSAADFWIGPSDNGDKWAVTQLLIWETINGHAFMQGNGLFGVEAAVDADMEKCAPHAYNPTKFLEYYRDLKKRLNDYMKVPSFANKDAAKVDTITLKWDGSKYTATEINVPNKYVKPQSQTFQLTEGQTASIHFENKLKRWRVTVTKSDDTTGSTPQGNGSLAGAKYGVYRGNELVKEYTTDENGQFTTDYYPYGEDWTLREISASPGYLVSEVSTKLCEIPAGSNEENNDNTATMSDFYDLFSIFWTTLWRP